MAYIKKSLSTTDKLSILSRDSQYDLACACSNSNEDHRIRSNRNNWIYPVTLPHQRQKRFMFKTLISNVCVNNCKYCPIRSTVDPQRCSLEPEKLAKIFMEYYRAGKVFGLFISSGVINSPDTTMEQINTTAEIIRNQSFRGYLHLKIIPGASDAAIEKAVSLADMVSVNIETSGQKYFQQICPGKDFINDVISSMKLISRLTDRGQKYARVKQTTQFVVGASGETDRDIVKYSWGLYKKLHLNRVYFSAYQKGLGESDLPGEHYPFHKKDILMREHRLYQVDWLIRKYGFTEQDILFDSDGNLSLDKDPKELWAMNHPEYFPLDVNTASKYQLLRVPGFGESTVNRIITKRQSGYTFKTIEDIGNPNKRLQKAVNYLKIGKRQMEMF